MGSPPLRDRVRDREQRQIEIEYYRRLIQYLEGHVGMHLCDIPHVADSIMYHYWPVGIVFGDPWANEEKAEIDALKKYAIELQGYLTGGSKFGVARTF